MSDFHQHGLIATLHRFGPPQRSLEEELAAFSEIRPIVLILPCHASEMGSEAVGRIVQGLKSASYLSEVVVSMNDVAPVNRASVRAAWEETGRKVTVLFNDRTDHPPGKGLNLWAAVGLISQNYDTATVVAHDCDILTYAPELLTRLTYSCANPEFSISFAKGYYSRVKERFYGRVTRLFLSPIMRTLIRVAGHQPLLDFLDCFRYPLAGEFAAPLEVLAALPISPGWRLEIGMLCEVFRRIEPSHVCQVDLGIDYDHKHQPLRAEGGNGGLSRMCAEISLELLSQVEREGVRIDVETVAALSRTYHRTAVETLHRYELDARINGLAFDREGEAEAVEVFADAFREAARAHVSNRGQTAILPPWK